MPFVLFLVPWPEPHMWPILAGAMIIHTVYKVLPAMTRTRGAIAVDDPVVRGTGPVFTVIGAGLAVATAAMVATSTTCDAYGIRATADPFTFPA